MKEKERQFLETTFAADLAEHNHFFATKFAEAPDWCNMNVRVNAIAFLREYRADFKLPTKEAFASQ